MTVNHLKNDSKSPEEFFSSTGSSCGSPGSGSWGRCSVKSPKVPPDEYDTIMINQAQSMMKRHHKSFHKRITKSLIRSVIYLLNFIEMHPAVVSQRDCSLSESVILPLQKKSWIRTCQCQLVSSWELLGMDTARGHGAQLHHGHLSRGWAAIWTKSPKSPPGLCMEESRVSPATQMDLVQKLSLSNPLFWGTINPKKEKTSSPQMASAKVWSISLVPQWYLIAAQMFTSILPLKPKVFMHSGKQTREQAMQLTPFTEYHEEACQACLRNPEM